MTARHEREEAARTQRLYDVVVGEDQRIIGAGMLQDTLRETDGHQRDEELGALMVHPAARGIGIVGLMIKLILVHRYAVLRTINTEEDYIAHVVDGNRGPIHALLAAGFEDLGPMKLHPGEFDGHIEHMMAPGENYVPMHAYRFNRNAIDNLIHDLWTFWHGGRELSRTDRNLRVKVDFSGRSIRPSWTQRSNASDHSAARTSAGDGRVVLNYLNPMALASPRPLSSAPSKRLSPP